MMLHLEIKAAVARCQEAQKPGWTRSTQLNLSVLARGLLTQTCNWQAI